MYALIQQIIICSKNNDYNVWNNLVRLLIEFSNDTTCTKLTFSKLSCLFWNLLILWIEDSAQKNYDIDEQMLPVLKQILDLTLQMNGILLDHCNKPMNLHLVIKNIAFKHPSLIDCLALIANFEQFSIFCEFIQKHRSELFYEMLEPHQSPKKV